MDKTEASSAFRSCQVPTFSITGAVVVFMSTLGAALGAVLSGLLRIGTQCRFNYIIVVPKHLSQRSQTNASC